MNPSAFTNRRGLYAMVHLAWWVTLIAFVASGGYRDFIKPSFVGFLWFAIVVLLVLGVVEVRRLGTERLSMEDVVRCGILLLPLWALFLAHGRPLNSYAFQKRFVSVAGNLYSPSNRRPSQPTPDSTDTSSDTGMTVGGQKAAQATETRQMAAADGNEPEPSSEKPHAGTARDPIPLTLLQLLQKPKSYVGKWVVTEGMALSQEGAKKDASIRSEAIVPGTFILFRFLIVCCVADGQPLGVLVKGAQHLTVADNGWYRVTGRYTLDKDKMTMLADASISRLPTAPDSPYLY